MAGLDLNQPFNWDEVEDLEGEILDLNYDYVCYLENEGINIKRRRHYPPDVKRTIYAKLLEKSNPGMMKEGVTKSVANEMGVPLRVVQRVWRHRQIGDGIEAFESKKKKYCGTKNFRLILVSSKMCRLDNAIASVTWPTLCIWQKPHCLGV
ncbi:hypothetical protein DAI22_02g140100 [Oryza sativa Japonica Group]|nr:hypothetical protein DAI22_02g140100 [Oryza sativa Japonica Group]